MTDKPKVRGDRRLLLPALAAAVVALASLSPIETPATAEEIVVKGKGEKDAAAGDTLSREGQEKDYDRRLRDAAAADTAAGDTVRAATAPGDTSRSDRIEYYLDFGSPQDTTGSGGKLYEIFIDDRGVVADTLGTGAAQETGVPPWDESESCGAGKRRREDVENVDFSLAFSYQRVDGVAVGLGQDLSHPDWRVPRIRLEEVYSSQREKLLYKAAIEQRLLPFAPFYAGASIYEITDSNFMDKEIVSGTENTLAAFFLKEDYRDYFGREGATFNARLDLPKGSSIAIEYLADKYSSLRKRADWSLFGDSRAFRPNPPIDDGDMKSIVASYSLDTVDEDRCVPNGALVRLSFERAGESLGGDFDFATVTLDARNYVKLNPSQFLRYRFMLGSRRDGRLPVQREFYAGGVGTLRGHSYKAMRGDQMILGNIEYGFYAGGDLGLYVLVDSGKAWYGDGGFTDQRLALDAGGGLEILCNGMQIYAAKNVKDSDSPLYVGVRFERTF